jgi:hypothetical protein
LHHDGDNSTNADDDGYDCHDCRRDNDHHIVHQSNLPIRTILDREYVRLNLRSDRNVERFDVCLDDDYDCHNRERDNESLSEILCVRHNMSMLKERNMYATQEEGGRCGDRGGAAADTVGMA